MGEMSSNNDDLIHPSDMRSLEIFMEKMNQMHTEWRENLKECMSKYEQDWRTLREGNKRLEHELKERKSRVRRENQRAYTSLNNKFDRLEREDHERRRRKEYEFRYDHKDRERRQRTSREKELKEKEIKEKELREKELEEKEIEELELLEKQMREKDDLLLVNTNPSFDIFDSYFEEVVGVVPKEDSKEQIELLLCEDVERNELNALIKDACDHLYKLPFDVIPNEELCVEELWNNMDRGKEVQGNCVLTKRETSLTLTPLTIPTLHNNNCDTIGYQDLMSWKVLENTKLGTLFDYFNGYFFRWKEEPKKEGPSQSPTPKRSFLISPHLNEKLGIIWKFYHIEKQHLYAFLYSLDCVNKMSWIYTLILNIKLDKVCLIFDPGGVSIVGEGQVNLGTS